MGSSKPVPEVGFEPTHEIALCRFQRPVPCQLGDSGMLLKMRETRPKESLPGRAEQLFSLAAASMSVIVPIIVSYSVRKKGVEPLAYSATASKTVVYCQSHHIRMYLHKYTTFLLICQAEAEGIEPTNLLRSAAFKAVSSSMPDYFHVVFKPSASFSP